MERIIHQDLLENKDSGIFALLDEECRMPNPKLDIFVLKVFSNHKDCSSFSRPHPSKDQQSGFVIRHFANSVFYSTVRENII